MRLRTQLVLFICIAYAAPLLGLGVWIARRAGHEVERRVAELQAQEADSLAGFVASWLTFRFDQARVATRTFDLAGLDEVRLQGFVRLVFQQVADAHIVLLTDRAGRDLAPPAFVAGEPPKEFAAKDTVDLARILALRDGLPFESLPESGPGLAFGTPLLPAGRDVPVLPVLIAVGDGETLLGLEIGLDELAARLTVEPGSTRHRALVDRLGRVVLASSAVGAALVDKDTLLALPVGARRTSELAYTTLDGVAVMAATAPVPATGWTAVVAERREDTGRAARDITNRIAFGAVVATVLSVVVGLLYARELSGPVIQLTQAAQAVALGQLGRTVPPGGSGEVNALMRAFNHMSESLLRNRDEIEAKKREIEAKNAELEARVEDLTRKNLESARLSAMGEMGAGLAHELNNPIAGILGMVQVVLMKREGAAEGAETGMLRAVEEQALRCKNIVAQLLRFTGEGQASAPLDRRDWDEVDLDKVVENVLNLVGQQLRQGGIAVEHVRHAGLTTRGDWAKLGRAVAQIMTSLRTVAPDGGTLRVEGRRVTGGENMVEMMFVLASTRLRLGADDWMASGMALWAARQVLAEHGGRLLEPPSHPPEPPPSAEWRVVLPADR